MAIGLIYGREWPIGFALAACCPFATVETNRFDSRYRLTRFIGGILTRVRSTLFNKNINVEITSSQMCYDVAITDRGKYCKS